MKEKEWQDTGNGPFLFKTFTWTLGIKVLSVAKQIDAAGAFHYGHSVQTHGILFRVNGLLA